MDDFYESIDDCKPNDKRKILMVFHRMIVDLLSNKKTMVTDRNIVQKYVRINSKHCFDFKRFMKICKKKMY